VVHLWEAESGRELARASQEGSLKAVGFGGEGKYLLTATDTVAQRSLWRPEELMGEACERLKQASPTLDWTYYLGKGNAPRSCPNR